MGKFVLLGEELITDQSRDNFIEISQAVDIAAMKDYLELKETIYGYSDLKTLASNIRKDMDRAFEKIVKQALPIFHKRDIYDLNAETFVNRYVSEYISIVEAAENVKDKYDEIIAAGEYEKEQREYEKENRSRWEGGGYGISGALKGYAQASLLNAAEGLIYSARNSIGNAETDRKVRNAMDNVVKNSGIQDECIDAFFEAVTGIKRGMMRALMEYTDTEFEIISQSDAERASNIVAAVVNDDIPEEKVKSQLIKAWNLDPLNEDIYKELFLRYGDYDNSIEEVGNYFSINVKEIKEEYFSKWFLMKYIPIKSINDKAALMKRLILVKEESKAELEKIGVKDDANIPENINKSILTLDNLIKETDIEIRTVEGVLYDSVDIANRIKDDITVFETIVNGRDLRDEKICNKVREELAATKFNESAFTDLIDSRIETIIATRNEKDFKKNVSTFKNAKIYPDRNSLKKCLPDSSLLGEKDKICLSYKVDNDDSTTVVVLTDKQLYLYNDYDETCAFVFDIREIKDIMPDTTYNEELKIVISEDVYYDVLCDDCELVSGELKKAVESVLGYWKTRPDFFAHETEKFTIDISDSEIKKVWRKCEEKNKEQFDNDEEILDLFWMYGDDAIKLVDNVMEKKEWEVGKFILMLRLEDSCSSFFNGIIITNQYIIVTKESEDEEINEYSPCFKYSLNDVEKLKVSDKKIIIVLKDRTIEIELDNIDEEMKCILSSLKDVFEVIQQKIIDKKSEIATLQDNLKRDVLNKIGDEETVSIAEIKECMRSLYIENDEYLISTIIEYLENLIEQKKEKTFRTELDGLTKGYKELSESELEGIINKLKEYTEYPDIVSEYVKLIEDCYNQVVYTRRMNEIKQYCESIDTSDIENMTEIANTLRSKYSDIKEAKDKVKELETLIENKKQENFRLKLDVLVEDYNEKTESELKEIIKNLKTYTEYPNIMSEYLSQVEKRYNQKVYERRKSEVTQYCENVDISDIWNVAKVRNTLKSQYSDISGVSDKICEYEDIISKYISAKTSEPENIAFDELENLKNKTQEFLSGIKAYSSYMDSITECMNKKGIITLERKCEKSLDSMDNLELYSAIEALEELDILVPVKNYIGNLVVNRLFEVEKGIVSGICKKWDAYCDSKKYDCKGFYLRYNKPHFTIANEQKLDLKSCSNMLDRNEYPIMLHGTGLFESIDSGFSKGFLITSKYLYAPNIVGRISLNEIVKFEVTKKLLVIKLSVVTMDKTIELQSKISGGQYQYIADMLLYLVDSIRKTKIQNISALVTEYPGEMPKYEMIQDEDIRTILLSDEVDSMLKTYGIGSTAKTKGLSTTYDVVIMDTGISKAMIVKSITDILGIDIFEAKALIEKLPAVVKSGVSKDEAEKIKKQLEESGAFVELI